MRRLGCCWLLIAVVFLPFYALGSNCLYNFLRAPRMFRRRIPLCARPVLVYVRERGNALSLPNLSAATPTSSWREVVRGRPARRSSERRLRSINESRRPNIAFGFTAKPHGNELNTTKNGDYKTTTKQKNALRMRAFGAVFLCLLLFYRLFLRRVMSVSFRRQRKRKVIYKRTSSFFVSPHRSSVCRF